MTTVVIPFRRPARPSPVVIAADTVARMARHVADHFLACADRGVQATSISLSVHLANEGWDCEEINTYLNAALRRARRLVMEEARDG